MDRRPARRPHPIAAANSHLPAPLPRCDSKPDDGQTGTTGELHGAFADVLNIASTIALIGALVFAALQVRVSNRMRAEQAALAIVEAIQSEGSSHSLGVIIHLPDGIAPEDIDARGPACVQAIEDYGVRIETVGYIVFRASSP